MPTVPAIFLEFFHVMAGMALVAILYGVVVRGLGEHWGRQVALGVLFGAASLYALSQRMELAPGVLMDMRHLPIAFAGAFGGPLAMAVTLTINVVARLAIGGNGVLGGLISMSVSGLAGLAWAWLFLGRPGRPLPQLLALGALICPHTLAALTLPWETAVNYFRYFAPVQAAFNVLGTLVVGGAIHRERTLALTAHGLEHSASRDPLTGALNRRGFHQRADAARARSAPGQGGALLALDLDHFKRVNDAFGHDVGDAVLVEAARRLQSELRGGDVLGRFGGEEFVVFVPAVSRERAAQIASRLRRAIGGCPFAVGGHALGVTVSVGAEWFGEGVALEEAIRRADALLYEAKAQGRNRIVMRSPGEGKTAPRPARSEALETVSTTPKAA